MITISCILTANMNTLTATVFFAAIACTMAFKMPNKDSPEAKAAFEACAKETGMDIDMATFAKRDHGDMPKDYKKIDSKIKCFVKCMMQKAELIDDKGVFNYAKVKELLELDDAIIQVSKDCEAAATETDPCERVAQISQCVHEKQG